MTTLLQEIIISFLLRTDLIAFEYINKNFKNELFKTILIFRVKQKHFSINLGKINDRYTSIVAPDMQFYVRLVGFYIAQTPYDSPFTERRAIKLSDGSINVGKALTHFENWLGKKSKDPSNPLPNYDSAALFTRWLFCIHV